MMPIQLSPRLLAYLEDLERGPATRPKGTVVGPNARRLGFTESEFRHNGRLTTAAQLKAELGPKWYRFAESTGREMLTDLGRQVLDQHRGGS